MLLMHKKSLPHLLLALALVLAINTAVFAFHWGVAPAPSHFFQPPDALVGSVWVGLFLLMGCARWNVSQLATPQGAKAARQILWFMIFCFSYPLYTLGLGSGILCLLGNIATFGAALYLVIKLRSVSPAATWLLCPVLPWLLYASATIIF